VPALHFFDAVASVAPLLNTTPTLNTTPRPKSRRNPGVVLSRAVGQLDCLVELSWRAKLHNFLPVDLEVEATAADFAPGPPSVADLADLAGSGAHDGASSDGHLADLDAPTTARIVSQVVRSGQQIELPIDELPIGRALIDEPRDSSMRALIETRAYRSGEFHGSAHDDAVGPPRLALRLRVLTPTGAWRRSRALELRLLSAVSSARAPGLDAWDVCDPYLVEDDGVGAVSGAPSSSGFFDDPRVPSHLPPSHLPTSAAGGGKGGGMGGGRRGGIGGTPEPEGGARVLTVQLGSGCTARLALDPQAAGRRAPLLMLWAPYWLINKTGLRLAYHLQRAQCQLDDTADSTTKSEGAAAAANAPSDETPESFSSRMGPSSASLGSSASSSVPNMCFAPSAMASAAPPTWPAAGVNAAFTPPTWPAAGHVATPMMIACEAGETLVVQVRPSGHQALVGGRFAAIRAPAIRGLLGGRRGRDRLAKACSEAFAIDAIGSVGEIPIAGGGVLGCTIEPAPGG
jgi:hypothetical protein